MGIHIGSLEETRKFVRAQKDLKGAELDAEVDRVQKQSFSLIWLQMGISSEIIIFSTRTQLDQFRTMCRPAHRASWLLVSSVALGCITIYLCAVVWRKLHPVDSLWALLFCAMGFVIADSLKIPLDFLMMRSDGAQKALELVEPVEFARQLHTQSLSIVGSKKRTQNSRNRRDPDDVLGASSAYQYSDFDGTKDGSVVDESQGLLLNNSQGYLDKSNYSSLGLSPGEQHDDERRTPRRQTSSKGSTSQPVAIYTRSSPNKDAFGTAMADLLGPGGLVISSRNYHYLTSAQNQTGGEDNSNGKDDRGDGKTDV